MPLRTCKICNETKELSGQIRSEICQSCSCKTRKPRLKTGIGWYLGDGGYIIGYVNGVQYCYHRWLMEQKIGRKLTNKEDVHHIDGNKLNNDINNLELLTKLFHRREHNGINKRLNGNLLMCTKCKKIKKLSDFPKRNNRPLGVQGKCKECWNKREKSIAKIYI